MNDIYNADRPSRDKAVASLRTYLSANRRFEEIELLKLWKGLFFCTEISFPSDPLHCNQFISYRGATDETERTVTSPSNTTMFAYADGGYCPFSFIQRPPEILSPAVSGEVLVVEQIMYELQPYLAAYRWAQTLGGAVCRPSVS